MSGVGSSMLPGGRMRQRSALSAHQAHIGPNMTPMIDVVMVILVFFMASSALLGPEWFIRTSLPKTRQSALPAGQTPPTRVVLALDIDANGSPLATMTTTPGGEVPTGPTTTVGPAPVQEAMEALQTLVSRIGTADMVVVIDPKPNVPYEDVVTLHAFCHGLEIRKVGLGMPTK